MIVEKARWELRKNATCCFEQLPEAAYQKSMFKLQKKI